MEGGAAGARRGARCADVRGDPGQGRGASGVEEVRVADVAVVDDGAGAGRAAACGEVAAAGPRRSGRSPGRRDRVGSRRGPPCARTSRRSPRRGRRRSPTTRRARRGAGRSRRRRAPCCRCRARAAGRAGGRWRGPHRSAVPARPTGCERLEHLGAQRVVVVGVGPEALGGVPALAVALVARSVEAVDAHPDDGAAAAAQLGGQLVGERGLAGAVHAVDAHEDGSPERARVGDVRRDLAQHREAGDGRRGRGVRRGAHRVRPSASAVPEAAAATSMRPNVADRTGAAGRGCGESVKNEVGTSHLLM